MIDVRPEDDLEVFLWFPEGEKLDSHGGEDDVGVTDRVDTDANKQSSRDKGNEAHPPIGLEVGVPWAPIDVLIE